MRILLPEILALSFCVAALGGLARGDAPQAVGPRLPGADIDLRSAWAVADAVVSGQVQAVDAERWMEAFDGRYGAADLNPTKAFKGEAARMPAVWLPIPSGGHSDLEPGKTEFIFYLWAGDHDRLRVFKAVPATPELLKQLAGLATQPASRPSEKPADSERLTAAVIRPPAAQAASPGLNAALRLTNEGRSPIRICSKGGLMGSTFTPASYKSDTPPIYDFARHIIELEPGKSVDIPISVPATHERASYSVSPKIAAKLDIWGGTVTAAALKPGQQ